ncbi:MAG: TolC family protein [Polyangiaceae bacterium]|nr:TolC family protein [Polyangiaceae bacterium]
MYMLGVRQEIPVLAALDADGRAEAELARAEAADGRDARRALYLQFAAGCVDWAVSRSLADRSREFASHLRSVREATAAAYGGGAQLTLGSIARADAEAARADRRAIDFDEQSQIAREALVALAGEDVALPELPPGIPEPPTDADVDAMLEGAIGRRGDVAAARARGASADARAESARAMADVPEFEVAATYMQMPGARPGLGAMVSMTMPWIGGALSDASEAAEAERDAARYQASAAERAASVDVHTQAARFRAARRVLRSIEEYELPASERAADAERAGLGGGGAFDLTAWLIAAHAMLEARIEREMAKGAVARSWVELRAAAALHETKEEP